MPPIPIGHAEECRFEDKSASCRPTCPRSDSCNSAIDLVNWYLPHDQIQIRSIVFLPEFHAGEQ